MLLGGGVALGLAMLLVADRRAPPAAFAYPFVMDVGLVVILLRRIWFSPQPSPHFSKRIFKRLRTIPRIDYHASFGRRAWRDQVSCGFRMRGSR